MHYLIHEIDAKEKFGKKTDIHNMYPMFENGKPVDCHNFLTYEFADRAMKFMDESEGTPYFCMLAFNAVHNFTWQLPEEELEKRGLPKYEDYNPNEVEYLDWYDGVIMPNLEHGREYYIAQLELMDMKIGEILDKVEEMGQLDNTLIVYATDNGGSPCNYGNNLPLTGTKYTLYEGGTRVQFIFSWNGVIPKNQSSRNLSSTLDLLPTFAYLAGADIPESNHNDGLSLMPTLLGENGGHDKLFFDTGFQYSVRDKEWKLLGKGEDFEDARKALLKVEHADLGEGDRLFNISENIDESEQSNFIQENPEITERLRNAFEEWKEDIESTKF